MGAPAATYAALALLLVLAAAPPAGAATDASPPEFGAPLTDEDAWVAQSPALLGIAVFDNGSGVDRVEYSWEYDGAPFIRWFPAESTPGPQPGSVFAVASVGLPEGHLSNILWRAWDRAGNGPSESRIIHVNVDSQNITYQNPYPEPDAWISDGSYPPSIWIYNESVSINRSSLEYRIANDGLASFGLWTKECQLPAEPPPPGMAYGGCLVVRATYMANNTTDPSLGYWYSVHRVHLSEGHRNWVQWRVNLEGDNRSLVSDPYNIRFDSKAPVVSSISPGPGEILAYGPVALRVTAHEGSLQGVAQRGINLSVGAATYRVRGPLAGAYGPRQDLQVIDASADGWSATFGATLDLDRGDNTVEFVVRDGGGLSSTYQTVIHVNERPSVLVGVEPATLRVPVNGVAFVTARVSDDGPGPLTVAWTDCADGAPLPSDGFNVTLSPDAVPALRTDAVRTILVCATATDEMGDSATASTEISVGDEPLDLPPPQGRGRQAPEDIDFVGFVWIWLLLAAVALAVQAVRLLRRDPPGGSLE